MPFARWRDHFARNALRPDPDLRDCARGIPEAWRLPLARSLAVFQLGESKGGRIASEIDRLPGVDPAYAAAIKRFIAEELHHGELLGACVDGLGGERLRSNWTDQLFVVARRLAGLRFKLVVLLAAEVVGVSFYRGLAARLPEGPLRTGLARLIDDEGHHLRFHGDAFRGDRTFRLAWSAVTWAAVAVVLIDHRRTHRALGISPAEVVARVATCMRGVAADLRRPPLTQVAPTSAPGRHAHSRLRDEGHHATSGA